MAMRGGSERSMAGKKIVGADLLQLYAGGVAGALGKTCTAPLSRLSVLMQLRGIMTPTTAMASQVPPSSILSGLPHQTATNPNFGGGLFHEARRIASEEGVRAFWKGNGVAILHRIPFYSISFYSYEKFKKVLVGWSSESAHPGEEAICKPNIGQKILAGDAAACSAVCATYPLDLVKTRLTAQTTEAYYKGILHALLRIPRDEGISSLYKGLGATLLSVAPTVAINIGVYEALKTQLLPSHPTPSSDHHRHHPKPSPLWSLALGSASAFVSSTFTFPLHVVKRMKQLEGARASPPASYQKRSSLAMFVHIARSEGLIRGFYRSILPEYLKVVPSIGITLAVYEYLKTTLVADV